MHGHNAAATQCARIPTEPRAARARRMLANAIARLEARPKDVEQALTEMHAVLAALDSVPNSDTDAHSPRAPIA